MEKYIKTTRIVLLALIMAAILAAYGLTLYRIQSIDTQAILSETGNLTRSQSVVYAARGSILDRNGELLVSDRTVYDVSISHSRLTSSDDPNGVILKLIRACGDYGVEYTDNFPVTLTAPFEYYADATSTQKWWMQKYFEYFTNSLGIEDPENPDVSATELVSWMREHYKIGYNVAAEDARLIMGVRFELEMRYIVAMNDYVFAQDITPEFLSFISEQNLPGVSVLTRSVREYHTAYAAHLLGYMGAIDPDEYENKYAALGYPMNAKIGKTGVEAAFEEYLHGTDGRVTVYTDENGAVNDVVVDSEAKAGSNVYLTISLPLQQAAEDSLNLTIQEMNRERTEQALEDTPSNEQPEEPELAEGGAVVVMDVHTGEVLALASYPTYNLATFSQDYAANSANPLHPFNNRALNGLYNPGSTFKMVTAYAALSNLFISPNTIIHDNVVFTEYQEQGYTPRCWSRWGHGDLNVVGALENSCNYFFYTVADRMGITPIAETARLFGLGSKTGIEINESEGEVASRELKRDKYNDGWYAADTILACIGQGLNRFTPIQLADYVSTIANGGTLYEATILRSVSSFDYTSVYARGNPTVRSVVGDQGGYIPVLQQGMRAVAKTGTAASALSNYRIPVAAKTGTVQSDNSAMNDGVFVCYAPANDPEIAIAVVVEKGGSGSALITIAKDVMDTYFSDTVSYVTTVQPDNTLLK